MIVILGVGHIFDIAPEVRRIIEEERPDAVGVELDPARYHALLHPGGQTNAPLTYRLLAMFQKRIAREYGGEAGAEMLEAAKAAKDIGADLLLIDADAGKLFRRMYQEMPFPEKVKLGLSAVSSLFVSSKTVEKEVENFQGNEAMYMDQVGEQFPTLKRILLDERNQLMARRLNDAASRYPGVLAVIGDGHVEGILELLGRDDVRVYRLRDIREKGRGPSAKGVEGNSEVRFHYEY